MSVHKRKSLKERSRERYPQKDGKKTALIILIGSLIMISGHLSWWEIEDYLNKNLQTGYIPQTKMEALSPAKNLNDTALHEPKAPIIETTSNDRIATFKGQKKIVIIIDDMGVNERLSKQIMALPAPLTLAFLPYAENVAVLAKHAKDKGHELMIHMPMEPLSADIDTGPIAIHNDMSPEDITANLDKAFKALNGYVGINNHMGSKVTQNLEIMEQVMRTLKGRGLYFIDSVTIGSTVAARKAAEHNLNYAERDVFLDHEETEKFVKNALKKLEKKSEERGFAIAIGHPKEHTIKALKTWIPKAKKRGFDIIPASAVVAK